MGPTTGSTKPKQVLPSGSLTGLAVVSQLQEKLGRVEEIVIESGSGRTVYAVVSFGALAGMGDRLFPLPWGLLRLDQNGEKFVLQLARERLKTAPGFSPQNRPRMSDRQWAREIHQFYGEEPHLSGRWERRSDAPGRRASDYRQRWGEGSEDQ
ncbi:MAG: PRC-barrel domain-containing protein [Desulfuromonadales bacterium]|nr:PRC-barrel domain-containing protein [Desulfuromonadales bacterium]